TSHGRQIEEKAWHCNPGTLDALTERRGVRTLRSWRAVFLLLVLHTSAHAMTAEELIGALKQMGSRDAEALEAFPLNIEEKRYDFLGTGQYLRVTFRNPFHPQEVHYVAGPDGKIYRLGTAAELERMQKDLEISIGDEDRALRYAQWLL